MLKHYPRYMIQIARFLRQNCTPAEKLLWKHLRNRGLHGRKFYRQFPIGRYIADFYCDELKLVVELEGKIHLTHEQRVYDENRFEELEGEGLRVLRFTNEEVFTNLNGVLNKILQMNPERPLP